MIIFEGPLAACATNAGIKVPEDLENYNPAEFPYWHVYRMSQQGAPMPHPRAHWDNAEVIAKIPESDIMKVTFKDLEEAGCVYGSSYGYI
jgi:hypothetical protein